MDRIHFRFFWLITLVTVALVGLCTVTAVSVFREQARIEAVLRENLGSRKAAVELEECLKDLETVSPERAPPLQKRASGQLEELARYADQPREQKLYQDMTEAYNRYLAMWSELPPRGASDRRERVKAATQLLDDQVRKPCHEFWEFNDQLLDASTRQHETVLYQLGVGMALVGGLGGVAGLVLGYGVARGLSRSIRRLLVQISHAAGMLGSPVPRVVLTQEGDFRDLHEQVDLLTGRIEKVVEELQQREREVLRAEQLAAVGQLAAGVAHEIRNPLTSIKLLVQLALEDPAGLPRDDLSVIENEVRKMEHSLQTFLDFARPPKPERRRIILHDVINDVLGLTRGRAEKQKIKVHLSTPASPIALIGDAGQLQQVLVNLVLNALDAMPAGGDLSLTVRHAGANVEVDVADTGPGVPEDLLPRLFQPFVSSKDTGLGLGLAISLRIAEDHGGAIGLANRPGRGATFTLRLPAGGLDAAGAEKKMGGARDAGAVAGR